MARETFYKMSKEQEPIYYRESNFKYLQFQKILLLLSLVNGKAMIRGLTTTQILSIPNFLTYACVANADVLKKRRENIWKTDHP